jgi:hypothetical protein
MIAGAALRNMQEHLKISKPLQIPGQVSSKDAIMEEAGKIDSITNPSNKVAKPKRMFL